MSAPKDGAWDEVCDEVACIDERDSVTAMGLLVDCDDTAIEELA